MKAKSLTPTAGRLILGILAGLSCCFLALVAARTAVAATAPVMAGPGQNLTIPTGDTVSVGTGPAISATGGGTVTGTGVRAASADATANGAVVIARGAGSTITLDAPTIIGNYVGAWMDSGGLVNLGDGAVINMTGLESWGTAGIFVRNNGTTNPGPGITVQIDSSGDRSTNEAWIGVSADGAGTSVLLDRLTVQGTGTNVGVLAGRGASVTLTDSALSINGPPGPLGIYYWPVGFTAYYSGSNALMAYEQGSITAINTNISVDSPDADGIKILNASTVTLDGVTLTQTQGGQGMVLFRSNGTARDSSITLTGPLTGPNAVYGVNLQTSTLQGDAMRLDVTGGEFSNGLVMSSGSQVTFDNGAVILRAANGFGVRAYSSTFQADNTLISVQGGSSTALRMDEGGHAVFRNGAISSDGSGAIALWLANATADIADTPVSVRGSDSIGLVASGASSTLNMSGGSLSSGGTALYVLSISDNALLNLSDGTRVTPGNGLLLDAQGGSTKLNADNGVRLTGDIQANIQAATPANVTVNLSGNTEWSGAARNTGAVTLSGNSLWNLTGDSDVDSLSLSGSAVNFGPPGASGYKTLTVRGDYSASNATITLNTRLGDSSSPTDKLVIQGDTSGSTRLNIVNVGGAGALTSGQGIDVVTVEGVSAGDFILADRVAAGLYEYLLHRNAADGNWYLSNAMDTPQGPRPIIRPEVPQATGLVPLAREAGYAMLDTLHKRTGEPRTLPGERPYGDDGPLARGWGRFIGTRGFHKAEGSVMAHGVGYDYSLGGVQAGLDVYAAVKDGGGSDRAGFYAGYSRTAADVEGIVTDETGMHRSGRSGRLDIDAYSLGAYWTHQSDFTDFSNFSAFNTDSDTGSHRGGWYSDAVAQGTYYHTAMKSAADERSTAYSAGLLASLEGGYSLELGRGIVLEPQAHMVWQKVFLQDISDDYGRFSFDDQQSLRGRVGVRLQKAWSAGSTEADRPNRMVAAWVRGNVWREFLGDSSEEVADLAGMDHATITTTTRDTWAEAEVGLRGQLNHTVSLFAVGAYQHSLGNDHRKGWDGRVGITIKW